MIRKSAPVERHADELLDALDALLAALHDSRQRNRVAISRAQTIRRLRSHGRSYREILERVAGAVELGTTGQSVDRLVEATARLQRAEVRALHGEGMAVPDIAVLCGIPAERATKLLAAEA